jgi:hypothetical protein
LGDGVPANHLQIADRNETVITLGWFRYWPAGPAKSSNVSRAVPDFARRLDAIASCVRSGGHTI